MEEVLREIKFERIKQDKKWGEQNHPCLDQTLLNRADGCTPERMCLEYEIPTENRAKGMLEIAFEQGAGTFAHIALEEFAEVVSEFNIYKRRHEIVQLAAVCVAWIQKIDRDLKKTENDTN
ncbi:hypothetical protein N4T20_02655 [Flavobacterium sp. TR2]|uniref:hypothetical protein n=1 Tax=Flavobacterium sp. TR2 TaxID=2977321 RepID=UPI0021B14545|nr:hypothetical protein [Flavobacterium sp. TR2]UWY28832.1 hypothetical protein N4T20_02655 [Flavobacterium sp. TR2]